MTETCLDAEHFPQSWMKHFHLDTFSSFAPRQLSVSSRLLVRPDMRKSTLLGTMLMVIYEKALLDGRLFNFNYCAPSLVRLYEQLGYRRYVENFNTEEGTYRLPMVLFCADQQYLTQVKSPFSRVLKKVPASCDPEAYRNVENTLPMLSRIVTTKHVDEPWYESRLWNLLRPREEDSYFFFQGLELDERRSALKKCVVIDLRVGDILVKKGESAKETFLCLNGRLQEEVVIGSKKYPLQVFLPGDVLSETALFPELPRPADIVATSPGRVVLLEEGTLDHFQSHHPQLSLKLMRNMLNILFARVSLLGKLCGLRIQYHHVVFSEAIHELGNEETSILTEFLSDESTGRLSEFHPVILELVKGVYAYMTPVAKEEKERKSVMNANSLSSDQGSIPNLTRVISATAWEKLMCSHPELCFQFMKNLARSLSEKYHQLVYFLEHEFSNRLLNLEKLFQERALLSRNAQHGVGREPKVG